MMRLVIAKPRASEGQSSHAEGHIQKKMGGKKEQSRLIFPQVLKAPYMAEAPLQVLMEGQETHPQGNLDPQTANTRERSRTEGKFPMTSVRRGKRKNPSRKNTKGLIITRITLENSQK